MMKSRKRKLKPNATSFNNRSTVEGQKFNITSIEGEYAVNFDFTDQERFINKNLKIMSSRIQNLKNHAPFVKIRSTTIKRANKKQNTPTISFYSLTPSDYFKWIRWATRKDLYLNLIRQTTSPFFTANINVDDNNIDFYYAVACDLIQLRKLGLEIYDQIIAKDEGLLNNLHLNLVLNEIDLTIRISVEVNNHLNKIIELNNTLSNGEAIVDVISEDFNLRVAEQQSNPFSTTNFPQVNEPIPITNPFFSRYNQTLTEISTSTTLNKWSAFDLNLEYTAIEQRFLHQPLEEIERLLPSSSIGEADVQESEERYSHSPSFRP